MTDNIVSFSISFGKKILEALLGWYQDVYVATGLTDLWIGVVVLALVFSIVIVPLRGGADLSHGALGSFVMNRVNRHKSHDD